MAAPRFTDEDPKPIKPGTKEVTTKVTTNLKASDVSKNGQVVTRVRWRNRRRMAWTSLASMLIVTYLIFFTSFCPESRLKILGDVVTWYYFASASIIGAYMGFTTWASRK